MKTPILLVTSDRWSQDAYVVFDDDQIIGNLIPDEWIGDAYWDALENDPDATRESVAADMEADFWAENSDIDEAWEEHGICRVGDQYFRYRDDGTGRWIDEDEALEDMPEVRERLIAAWRAEQMDIATSEAVTPRQANVMDRFGADAQEMAELADDTSLLRRHRGRLYVYEGQLGEPPQWRILQPSPHMPTGTLRRPAGA